MPVLYIPATATSPIGAGTYFKKSAASSVNSNSKAIKINEVLFVSGLCIMKGIASSLKTGIYDLEESK